MSGGLRRRLAARARLGLFCAGLGLLGAGAQAAEPAVDQVRIAWGQAQRFELQRQIAGGGVLEVCGPLSPRQAVDWQFVASGALSFSIHHRIGKQRVYAERRHRTKSLTSRLKPELAADFCWSWTAPVNEPIQLQLLLRH